MQAHNLCLQQNNFCFKVVILPKVFFITVFFKAIMFTLTFPCQVVNHQDINMPSPDPILCCYQFCRQQQENAATQDFMVTNTLF
jgi:hypothetical protein